jgi:hypothetical protein
LATPKSRNKLNYSRQNFESRISSPIMIMVVKRRKIQWVVRVARMIGKPEGNRPLRRPRRIWEDNIKMDLKKIGCVGVDWIELSQDWFQWRVLANTVMSLRFP